MTIKSWPESERPREKMRHRGASSLSDAELLAVILRSGHHGGSAVELARDLIAEFGSLRMALTAGENRVCEIRGMGPVRHGVLEAVWELCRRLGQEILESGEKFTSPDQVKAYLRAHYMGYRHEVFSCLFLNTRHELIRFENLFQGTVDMAQVYPRVVVERGLYHGASALIVAHNHPSGHADPSSADIAITSRLREAAGLLDLRLLDHMIIGEKEVFSMAEGGYF